MGNEPEFGDRRAHFVIEMYRMYWTNKRRSMEGLWKVLGPVTIVGTIVAGAHLEYLPASLGFSLAFIVLFWALNVTIDLNAWHRRNLFLLVKAERKFLADTDYGDLLPARYRKPPVNWITCYKINAWVFIALLAVAAAYGLIWKPPRGGFVGGWLLPLLVLAIGALLTAVNAHAQERSANRSHAELFEGDIEGEGDSSK
ncbi:MAG: hypothetical protein ACOC7S_01145 [Planctomycetota bacterium]